jgi:anti-sigma factor RsiW
VDLKIKEIEAKKKAEVARKLEAVEAAEKEAKRVAEVEAKQREAMARRREAEQKRKVRREVLLTEGSSTPQQYVPRVIQNGP